MKSKWVTILIFVFIIAISYYAISINGHNMDDKFSKCLAENSTLYIQTGCFTCQKQEDLFGENFKNLNVVNCAEEENYDVCFVTEQIQWTPTWIVRNEKYVGYKTFEELSEMTGCPLN